jgi:sulfite exporter TauE/SafE/copper chaperone CopZ
MNNSELKKYTFHIHGIHCSACALLTESEILEIPNIKNAKTNLKNHLVEIEGSFGHKTEEEILSELNLKLEPHGYKVSIEKEIKNKKWSDFKIAVPVTLVFGILFIMIQKLGLVNFVSGGDFTYGTAFVIGIIASLSTCMAVVGGLVLSMSATFAREGDKIKPQLMFHIGRIISFFVLGGVIGMIGSAFTLNTSATFILSLIIGLVMLILGINLLDIFSWAKKIQPSMPKFIASRAHNLSKLNHQITPFLVGVATFFLPCGFTQSMQLYTLTTGSFLKGGLTMLIFALGTLPVLALVSFSSFSIKNSSKSGVFFKTAGLIVIMFALFNLINSLVMIGIIEPIFNF